MLTKPLAAPILVAALLLPAGCSDGSSAGSSAGPSEAPTAPSSSSGSPSASASSPDASASDEPSSGTATTLPFPDVAPAAGRLLRETVVEIRAPQGWRTSAELAEFASGAFAPGDASLTLTDNDLFSGEGLPEQTTDEQATSLLGFIRDEGLDYERLPDVDLGRVTAVRVGGTNSSGLQEVRLYAKLPDRTVQLSIQASRAILRRDPDLFESVINTWTWI